MKQHSLFQALLFTILLLSNVMCYAQQASAIIDYPGSKGLYQITLPQNLRGLIGNNTSGIRIVNKQGVAYPYVITKYKHNATDSLFTIINNVKYVKHDSTSSYLLQFENNNVINEIYAQVANTTVDKNYIIEGSNDTINWYSISDNMVLSNLYATTESFVFKNISLPRSNYRFIKITFNDSKSAPLKILQWGLTSFENQKSSLEQVKDFALTIKQDTKAKTTILAIKKNKKIPISSIQFHISGPQFYNRNVNLYIEETQKINQKVQVIQDVLFSFNLNHTSNNTIDVGNIENETFYVLIQNEDNPTLQIDSISLWSHPLQIVAQLDAQQEYQLIIDTTLSTPQYDLTEHDIHESSALIQPINLKDIQFTNKVENTNNASTNKWILWICIGIGVIIMFYFGSKLLADMKSK